MKVRLEFNPANLWVGVHLKRKLMFFDMWTREDWHLYVTLIPMFPLHIIIQGKKN